MPLKTPEDHAKSKQDLQDSLLRPFIEALEKRNINADFLADLLVEGAGATVTKTAKLRGRVNPGDLPPVVRILAYSSKPMIDKAGLEYEDGDTLIAWEEINHPIRQDVRMDAHKLRGDYPAMKHEVSGPSGVPLIPLTDEQLERLEQMKAILKSEKTK